MKSRTLSFFFLVLMVCALVFVLTSAATLPPRLASHFDLSGTPNGWMSPSEYLPLMLGVLTLIPGLLWSLPLFLHRLPLQLINLPHRDYWFAPERAAESLQALQIYMRTMACFLVLFLTDVHWQVVQANRHEPPQLSGAGMGIGLIVFLIASGIWSLQMHRRFRKPA